MTTSLTQLASAIETRCETVSGLRAYSYVPEDVQVPAAFVSFGTIERSAMVLGTSEIPFELVVLVSSTWDRSAMAKLYAFANPDATDSGSVWAAFDANETLSLSGVDVTLLRFRFLGVEEIAAYRYYGGAFEGVALITKS